MEQAISLTGEFFIFLQEETTTVAELIRLAEEQRQALTGFKVQSLQVITQKQAQCSEHLRHLERQRVTLLTHLLGISYVQASALCLSDLMQMVSSAQATLLQGYQTELQRLTAQLVSMNNLNRMLTDRSRRFLQETTRILTRDGMPIYNVKV